MSPGRSPKSIGRWCGFPDRTSLSYRYEQCKSIYFARCHFVSVSSRRRHDQAQYLAPGREGLWQAPISALASFRQAVRFDQAVAWFLQNEPKLDDDTRPLWRRAALRCRLAPVPSPSKTLTFAQADRSAPRFRQNEPKLVHN